MFTVAHVSKKTRKKKKETPPKKKITKRDFYMMQSNQSSFRDESEVGILYAYSGKKEKKKKLAIGLSKQQGCVKV